MSSDLVPADVRALLAERSSGDADRSAAAVVQLLALADEMVPWGAPLWDELLADLASKDNQAKAFAAQLLARLARSVPARGLEDVLTIAALMRDSRTVTARLTVQSIWRIGLAGPKHARRTVDALAQRFDSCAGEKSHDMIRLDIMTSLGRLAAQLEGEPRAEVDAAVARLVGSESDPGVQFKQNAAFRKGLKLPASP